MIELICPDCKETLQLMNNAFSCDKCKKEFYIKEGIPVFLSNPIENTLLTNYIEHYQNDGKGFNYYKEEDKQVLHDMKRMKEIVTGKIPKTARKILDVGAGSNWVAGYAIPKGKEVFAVDISFENIKVAKDKYAGDNYIGLVADAFSLPFKPETFDCIIASEIIEHTVDPKQFITKLIPLLKSDGRLILSTPYKEKIPQYLCIHCNKLTPANAHLHSFDKIKLRNLVEFENTKKVTMVTYSNKFLSFLRSYFILKFLPFSIWRAVDWISNKVIPKPAKILTIVDIK